ncbi:hypothetical protein [Hydrogenophaga sp.]|uniref:hypothetical protein n=1 Tax=Hydrogenophaga sp. TaxID=1904254 RepID=UPI0035B365C7
MTTSLSAGAPHPKARLVGLGRLARPAAALAALCLALGAVGCAAPLQAPPTRPPEQALGAWVELVSEHHTEIRPGVVLELPKAPYRVRFADQKGTYYAPSQRLVFRTQHGLTQENEGGLYVRHDRPGWAQVWLAPVAGLPAMPFDEHVWAVRQRRP